MKHVKEFVDERLKSWCIVCGHGISDQQTNLDHVPSKCLLQEPHPANLPKILVHKDCNRGFSLDEEYVSIFLACVLIGSTEPDLHTNSRIARALKRKSKLRTRIETAKNEQKMPDGSKRLIWTPELDRVERVVLKNSRGHVFYEYGEPILHEPKYVRITPLETLTVEKRSAFENVDMGAGWPEVGSRMMTRLVTGQDLDNSWIVVQPGIYRYAVMQDSGILVKSVLSEYLAVEVYWEDQ